MIGLDSAGGANAYEAVIGMELHAQLQTASKMFCGCDADYWEAPPNSHVCPVCLGMPGVLPVINAHAVEQTVRTGLALNCQIAQFSVFARKNYNYPDLPKGYQISQYELPFCHDGWIMIDGDDGQLKRIGIRRAHLEEEPVSWCTFTALALDLVGGQPCGPRPSRRAVDGDRHRGGYA